MDEDAETEQPTPEITKAMIEAGVYELLRYRRDLSNEEQVVADVFTAMMQHYQDVQSDGSVRP